MSDISIRTAADLERPYEKCLARGPRALSDAELLAVIIRCGTCGTDSVALAEKILALPAKRKGLSGIAGLSAAELTAVPGIGRVKAVQILCVGEISRRMAIHEARKSIIFSDPDAISAYFMEQLRYEEQELLILVMLDAKNRFLGEQVISRGTVDSALFSVREVFLTAFRYAAVRIILVHNHPSGDPMPSPEDMEATRRIAEAGRVMSIVLLDHIIIGDDRSFSFLKEGFMKDL